MAQFDINSLIETNLNREDKHKQVYDKILKKVYHKIKLHNKKRIYKILYEIPNYMFGYALYNTKTCLVYIIKTLRNNGLSVKFTYPNLLIISWEEAMRTRYKKQPVQQFQNTQTRNNMIQQQTKQKPKTNYSKYNKMNNDLVKSFETGNTNNVQNTNNKNDMSQHFNQLDDLANFSKFY